MAMREVFNECDFVVKHFSNSDVNVKKELQLLGRTRTLFEDRPVRSELLSPRGCLQIENPQNARKLENEFAFS